MPTPSLSPRVAATGGWPPGATDVHVHVFDPARFGYCAGRSYTPGNATVEALLERHAGLGIERAVLVQPSVYGTDNGCMLDALARLGPERSRGIAVVDLARTSRAELVALHAAGVRGIRLNLEVRHEADPARARKQLEQAAALVDLPGWCVQVYCAASLLDSVAAGIDRLRVPLVLDHFAGLNAQDAGTASGTLRTLLALLATGRVYVKLSAFYRASAQGPHHADLGALVGPLLGTRPDRLLWGSDWPHTSGGRDRDPERIEPFRPVDLAASLDALASWAAAPRALRRILVDNPAELYGFAPPARADGCKPDN
ncbi:amidohydrolase family protein [Caldimonas tepidiphila]|uniref:amidohydrolase family protein n=1 Tax=Caldimonas tepidiphila TaxID=2315841 RepID=UPI000E5BB764|nr:amidohydrolase family protein [Caldimonas tepidiphila]